MSRDILIFDPVGGVSGDMFMGALLDLQAIHIDELTDFMSIVLPEIEISVEETTRCSLRGLQFHVIVNGEKELPNRFSEDGKHFSFKKIRDYLDSLNIDQEVRETGIKIFDLIAQAEARVHGKSLEEIHFHEVGRGDSITDVMCAAYAIRKLNGVEFYFRPLPFGHGPFNFSHGDISAPAPATAEIVKGIPTIFGRGEGEMTTPTGAAIVKMLYKNDLAHDVAFRVLASGWGFGERDTAGYPNGLRVFHAEFTESDRAATLDGFSGNGLDMDEVIEMSCNIDDQPPHLVAPLLNDFLGAGALDVYVSHYMGKKNRQGQCWTILATKESFARISGLAFSNLGTIGLRYESLKRIKLFREPRKAHVEGHEISFKRVYGSGIDRMLPEIDDVHRLAKLLDKSYSETYQLCLAQAAK